MSEQHEQGGSGVASPVVGSEQSVGRPDVEAKILTAPQEPAPASSDLSPLLMEDSVRGWAGRPGYDKVELFADLSLLHQNNRSSGFALRLAAHAAGAGRVADHVKYHVFAARDAHELKLAVQCYEQAEKTHLMLIRGCLDAGRHEGKSSNISVSQTVLVGQNAATSNSSERDQAKSDVQNNTAASFVSDPSEDSKGTTPKIRPIKPRPLTHSPKEPPRTGDDPESS
jgi:hypothetical protein